MANTCKIRYSLRPWWVAAVEVPLWDPQERAPQWGYHVCHGAGWGRRGTCGMYLSFLISIPHRDGDSPRERLRVSLYSALPSSCSMLIDSLIFSLVFLEPQSGIPRESEVIMLNSTVDSWYRVCTSALDTKVAAEQSSLPFLFPYTTMRQVLKRVFADEGQARAGKGTDQMSNVFRTKRACLETFGRQFFPYADQSYSILFPLIWHVPGFLCDSTTCFKEQVASRQGRLVRGHLYLLFTWHLISTVVG